MSSSIDLTDAQPGDPLIALCNSTDLVDGGRAVGFDVEFAGQTCRAFVFFDFTAFFHHLAHTVRAHA